MRRSCVLLALASLASVDAADSVLAPPPPMAKRATVAVNLDESTEIPLNIGGRIVEPVHFLIRKPPKSGSLSEPRRTGKNSASVFYTPHPGISEGLDSFSFAAQSSDSPVSASAAVTLQLREAPADLKYEKELDFGSVFLGDSSNQTLVIKNHGGGALIEKMVVASPWRVVGSREVFIPSGGAYDLGLIFDPQDERDYTERLSLAPHGSILLRGRALAPLVWKNEGIVFTPEQRRTGKSEIQIFNRTRDVREVTFVWPESVRGPSTLTVPSEGSVNIPLEIHGEDVLAFESKVSMWSLNFHTEIPMKVFPAPPRITVSPVERLVFERALDGAYSSGRLTVRNSGGVDATLQVTLPEGFFITPDPASLVLAPGREITFEVQSTKDSRSMGRNNIVKIESPGAPSVERELILPTASRFSMPVGAILNIQKTPAVEIPPVGEALANLTPVGAVEVSPSESHAIDFDWDIPSPEAVGFRIERRTISIGKDGQPVIGWQAWPEVAIRVDGGTASARISHLPPDTFWTVRITSQDKLGRSSLPSKEFYVSTGKTPPRNVSIWFWLLSFGAISAMLIRWAVFRRRQHLAQEDARLERLQAE
jgi:hypothetical protein